MKELTKINKQLKKHQQLINSLQMQTEFNMQDIETLNDKNRSSNRMTKHEKLSLVIGAIVNLFICAASIKYLFFN